MSICYDFQKWSIISLAMVTVSLTVGLVLINFAHGLDTVNDTFKIDTILSKNPISYADAGTYKFTKGSQLELSNSDIVCPSNNCKTTLKDEGFIQSPILSVSEESGRTLIAFGDFSLIDDKSNGQLSPKKQKLVQEMSINFGCTYNDIQEDTKNNTTKYICSKPDILDIVRKFNSTHYKYRYTATFELPSRHLVLNATEVHDDPFLFSSGDRVYRNETGQIVVK